LATAAIIVAAGRGVRAGGDIPKQYQPLAGKPVLAHAINAFGTRADIDRTLVVLHPDDAHLFADLVAPHLGGFAIETCLGGEARAASVRAGLEVLAGQDIKTVLVHDGARPLVSDRLILRVLAATREFGAAAPAMAVTDTLWENTGGFVGQTVERAGLARAQTPQGFDFTKLLSAHRAGDTSATDDVQIARAAGQNVKIVAGEPRNIKITEATDFQRAAQIIGGGMDIRTGNGFDVHAFIEGDHVILCGVKIPHERGLKGHSDADVALHAVSDAIYGALGQGDIGQWFPPSEARWKNAASDIFLRHAMRLATDQGFILSNADCTIICESPKIGPHAQAMRARLAEITGVAPDRLSVKATTSERLGFTGRKEGIAALATVTLLKS